MAEGATPRWPVPADQLTPRVAGGVPGTTLRGELVPRGAAVPVAGRGGVDDASTQIAHARTATWAREPEQIL